jgi:repressor LexA
LAAKAISGKQKQIINFIRQYLRDNGYPPSVRDIVNGCNISSTSVVVYNLNKLEEAGYIRRRGDISRGIELLDSPKRGRGLIYIPIIGEIAAGEPIPVPDSGAGDIAATERLLLSEGLIREKDNVYAVRVKGESMVDALIGEGDIVLVDYVDSVEDGDMVAVWLKREQEVTLKKLFKEGNNVRLESANSQVKPIYTTADNIDIQGKVVAVIRRMT